MIEILFPASISFSTNKACKLPHKNNTETCIVFNLSFSMWNMYITMSLAHLVIICLLFCMQDKYFGSSYPSRITSKIRVLYKWHRKHQYGLDTGFTGTTWQPSLGLSGHLRQTNWGSSFQRLMIRCSFTNISIHVLNSIVNLWTFSSCFGWDVYFLV